MLSRGFQALRRVCTKAGSSGRNAPTKKPKLNAPTRRSYFRVVSSLQHSHKLVFGSAMALAFVPAYYALQPNDTNNNEVNTKQEKTQRTQDLVRLFKHIKGVPGVVVVVMKDGKIQFEQGFGYADVENGLKMKSNQLLRIASISKAMTSAALGQLIEQGLIDIDKPISEYLPDYPQQKDVITTRMLAGHLSGTRHYKGTEFLSNKEYETTHDAMEVFKNDPLGHQPGEKFTYTSHGFTLLSAVIERVTKQAFVDHMKQNVFEKMGLEDTTTDGNADLMLNRSKYYYRSGCSSSIRASEQERKKVAEEASTNDSSVKEAKIKPKKVPVTNCALQNSPQVDNSMKWAGGGFVSTARDVALFGYNLVLGDFLKSSTKELLFAPQQLKDGKFTEYGLGWQIHTKRIHGVEEKIIGHAGGAVGASSHLLVIPSSRVVVAIIGNLELVGFYQTALKIAKVWHEK